MSNDFKMPTANELWDWELPSVNIDQSMDFVSTLLEGNLPTDFDGKLYAMSHLTGDGRLREFLDGDEFAPFLRVAGTMGLLDRLAADPFFNENDRRHVDREKIALFYRILGGELPIDSKTASGASFDMNEIKDFPSQARAVIDQCQVWAYAMHWTDIAFIWFAPKEMIEPVFRDLLSQVSSPINVVELQQKLLRGEQGVDGLQQLVFSFYVKLAVLERALQRASRVRTSDDKFSKTRECIMHLCDDLSVSTIGGLDDTTRAQIRSLIRFWALVVFNLIDPDTIKRNTGRDFINEYARKMQVWVD
ncbi:gata zinc finger domain containing protein [Colletotrichum sp. SAR11_240]|nr:gata zinc finger domain containing protein [Colletotrichum sp. SAR11_240]